jgi:hypothetical protein
VPLIQSLNELPAIFAMKVQRLVSAFFVSVLPLIAFPETVTYTTDKVTLTSGVQTALNLQQFDSSSFGGATLTGVSIVYHYSVADFTTTYYNNSAASINVAQQFEAFVSSLKGGTTAVTNSLASINLAPTSITVGSVNYADSTSLAPEASTIFSYSSMDRSAAGSVLNMYNSLYQGSGMVSTYLTALDALTTKVWGAENSGKFSVGENTAYAAITYTYTPVPEPSTYALFLGVGTLGLIGWRRFRRK